MPSTNRSRFRPTSAMVSRLPQPTPSPASWIACPPSWTMPASNVTRVRRLGRSKSIASVRRTRGGSAWRRGPTNSAFSPAAVSKTRRTSAGVRSAAMMKSRPWRDPTGAISTLVSRRTSAFRVLRRLAGPLESVFLAFLHPRVAGQQAGAAEDRAMEGVELQQRPGDPVADRAGLAGEAAALDLDHRVEATLGPRHPEGHADVRLVDRRTEMLQQGAAIHDDLAVARQEPDARDGRLATTGSGQEGGGGHAGSSVRRAAQAAGPDGDGQIRRRP